MSALLREPLFYIFFVYGVSFLVMAYVVINGVRNATSIALVNTYYALAAFGLTHGITEMIDWLRFIVKTMGHGEIPALKYLSQSFLIVSFVVLLQFGVNLLTYRIEKRRPFQVIPAILFGVYLAALFVVKPNDIAQAGLIARYTFGFAGAFVSGIALFELARHTREFVDANVTQGLLVTALSFCCYAVFGGLVVKPIMGMPVQLFRAGCAVAIAVASFHILGIFRAERRDRAAVAEMA